MTMPKGDNTFFWIILVIIFMFLFSKLILPLLFVGLVLLILWRKGILKPSDIAGKIAQAQKQERTASNGSSPKKVIDYNKINFINPTSMKKVPIKAWGAIIAVLIVIFIIMDGLVSVPAGHVAVIYDRGRGILEESLPPGLHLKIPFWQVATIMDTRMQAYTMSISDDEGYFQGDDSIESLTKDGQKVYVDATLQYKILPEDAPWIYNNVGSDEVYLEKVVRPGSRNVVRDVITGFDSTKLFTQETRLEAQQQMYDKLNELYGRNHIQLEEVLLRNIKFSEVYLQAIEDKQVAQQRIQKAEYEKQEAEKTKEKKIIEAEAEKESINLRGEALRANPEIIQLEFVQKMAPGISWGILPSGAVPFIDIKSLTQ